jgi:hypothetical protein
LRPKQPAFASRSIGVVPEIVSISTISDNTMIIVVIDAGDGSDAL